MAINAVKNSGGISAVSSDVLLMNAVDRGTSVFTFLEDTFVKKIKNVGTGALNSIWLKENVSGVGTQVNLGVNQEIEVNKTLYGINFNYRAGQLEVYL